MDWMTSESGFNVDEAKGVLTSMIDLGILLMQESSYSINTKFTSKRLKLKFANVANFQEKEERAIAKKAVDEDRVFFIQAIIVRIMKSRKTLSHLGLIDKEPYTVSFNRKIGSVGPSRCNPTAKHLHYEENLDVVCRALNLAQRNFTSAVIQGWVDWIVECWKSERELAAEQNYVEVGSNPSDLNLNNFQ